MAHARTAPLAFALQVQHRLLIGAYANSAGQRHSAGRDMDVASETMELFRRHYSRSARLQQQDAAAAAPAGDSSAQLSSSSSSKEPGGGVDVQVTVLTQAHWPTQTLLELNLPSVSCSRVAAPPVLCRRQHAASCVLCMRARCFGLCAVCMTCSVCCELLNSC
jgi:hypothetical protein